MKVKRSFIHPTAAEGQACEEAHLAMYTWADSADWVYAGHWTEQRGKYCGFTASSNRRSWSGYSWLGNLHKSQQFYQLLKENIMFYSEIIISNSKTCILTLTFVSQPCFYEKPWVMQNTRYKLSVTVAKPFGLLAEMCMVHQILMWDSKVGLISSKALKW